MNSSIDFSEKTLRDLGAYHTSTEIRQQPDLWIKLFEETVLIKEKLKGFLDKPFSHNDLQVILTGAGTSAFIGDALEGIFQKRTHISAKAISTTDLITNPELYLIKNKPLLLISFARSGNSPESSQVIEVTELFSATVYHLIITCNKVSKLTETVSKRKHFIYYMPPEANDESLAMTSSFTSMLLAGVFISRINEIESLKDQVELAHEYGNRIISDYLELLKGAVKLDFNRAVFLGSGAFKGIARESQLKLQELTDGKVICKFDSFLGFRHGPKCVVNEKTLVVYIFSNNNYVNKYEVDLVNDVNSGRKSAYSIGIMEKDIDVTEVDLKIVLSKDERKLEEDFLIAVSVLPAQILGFFKSLNLNLKPDSPSDSGMIHRVVQGVNIYPYHLDENNVS